MGHYHPSIGVAPARSAHVLDIEWVIQSPRAPQVDEQNRTMVMSHFPEGIRHVINQAHLRERFANHEIQVWLEPNESTGESSRGMCRQLFPLRIWMGHVEAVGSVIRDKPLYILVVCLEIRLTKREPEEETLSLLSREQRPPHFLGNAMRVVPKDRCHIKEESQLGRLALRGH